jgi:hypothetical protein
MKILNDRDIVWISRRSLVAIQEQLVPHPRSRVTELPLKCVKLLKAIHRMLE